MRPYEDDKFFKKATKRLSKWYTPEEMNQYWYCIQARNYDDMLDLCKCGDISADCPACHLINLMLEYFE